MKKLYEPSYKQINGLIVKQIVVDQSEWVTLWGYQMENEARSKMDFITEFDTLNKLLRHSGDLGDEIQMLIVERLEKDEKGPQVIDLEAIFGMPAVLDCCPLKVYHPQQEKLPKQWMEDPKCLFIDQVLVTGKLKRLTADTGALYRRNFNQCIQLLVKSYQLYLGYLELDYEEGAAQEKAGLSDEIKFKMAYYAWKSASGLSLN